MKRFLFNFILITGAILIMLPIMPIAIIGGALQMMDELYHKVNNFFLDFANWYGEATVERWKNFMWDKWNGR